MGRGRRRGGAGRGRWNGRVPRATIRLEVGGVPWLRESEREALRQRLSALPRDVVLHVFTRDDRLIVPGRDPSPFARETLQLMEELAGLSPRLRVAAHDLDRDRELAERFGVERAPAIVPVADDGSPEGRDYGIRFYGLPQGYEFATFIEAVEGVARGAAELEAEAASVLAGLAGPAHVRVFTTPT